MLPDETVWACTTCGWCEQACPVFIENIPRIIDMRRNKVQVEAEFPAGGAARLRGHGDAGQPVGHRPATAAPSGRRPGHARPAATIGGGSGHEYLFFVGCAGSYDDRQKKVRRALVKILREAA